MTKLEQIREQIVQAVEQSGLKKIEIAKRVGVKQPTLSKYLSGRAMPTLGSLTRVEPYKVLETKNRSYFVNLAYNTTV